MFLPFYNVFAGFHNMGCRHITLTKALTLAGTKATMAVVFGVCKPGRNNFDLMFMSASKRINFICKRVKPKFSALK